MARVTVEDCIDKVDNRFDLVLLAAHRARMISSGSQLTIDRDNDKNPVVSLREIADSTISPEDLREELVHSLQKFVEVDEPVLPLVRDVAAEQAGQRRGEVGAPREAGLDDLGHRRAGVHAAGVDVGADRGARGPARGADQVVLGAQPVHQVGDVGRVEHAELGRQRERLGVLADDPVRDRVECAPADPLRRGGMTTPFA